MTVEQSQIAHRKSQILAWQGWRLAVPADWNPVKVDGDFDEGSLMIADLHAAKLGLRWRRAHRRGDAEKWADKAMRQEVGQLAAREAKALEMPGGTAAWRISRLYTEPEPPGRDVWLGWSETSGRVLEIVYHARRRDRIFADDVLSSLQDTPRDQSLDWSIFDLSCRSPAGLTLQWYKLNAGDLSLAFSRRKGRGITIVRQLGPASLALARQPLEKWMNQQRPSVRKLYRPMTTPQPADVPAGDRTLEGLQASLQRKRRLCWAWMVARRIHLLAAHDVQRNRIVLGQGEDESVLREVMGTIGWARPATGGGESPGRQD